MIWEGRNVMVVDVVQPRCVGTAEEVHRRAGRKSKAQPQLWESTAELGAARPTDSAGSSLATGRQQPNAEGKERGRDQRWTDTAIAPSHHSTASQHLHITAPSSSSAQPITITVSALCYARHAGHGLGEREAAEDGSAVPSSVCARPAPLLAMRVTASLAHTQLPLLPFPFSRPFFLSSSLHQHD